MQPFPQVPGRDCGRTVFDHIGDVDIAAPEPDGGKELVQELACGFDRTDLDAVDRGAAFFVPPEEKPTIAARAKGIAGMSKASAPANAIDRL